MTVAELIEALGQFRPEAEVMVEAPADEGDDMAFLVERVVPASGPKEFPSVLLVLADEEEDWLGV